MPIIVGLGNPGKEYENTYHNTGWRAVDKLAEKLGKKIKKAECSALIWTGTVGGERVVLAKPLTYMNLSGDSVKSLCRKFKVEPIIVYDDIDIPAGTVRARESGSGGTHNGMRDVINKMGTEKIKRIRIGIGRGKGELKDYVLSVPSAAEAELIDSAVDRLTDALMIYLKDHDFEKLMRSVN